MNLYCVPPAMIVDAWPHASRFVQQAMDRVGISDVQGVAEDIVNMRALLWLVVDGETVSGAVVTQILVNRSGRICEIVACGADDISICIHLIADLEKYARDEECHAMRLIGRKGWARKLSDYRIKAMIMEKAL